MTSRPGAPAAWLARAWAAPFILPATLRRAST